MAKQKKASVRCVCGHQETVEANDGQPTVDAICPRCHACVHIRLDGETYLSVSGALADEVESVTKKLLAEAKKKNRSKQPVTVTGGGGASEMIDHLKDLTDRILAHTLGPDLFNSHREIYRELEKLSPEQFESSKRSEFLLARGAFERLVKPNVHQLITGSMIEAAAKKLRPVLDRYVGAAPQASTPVQQTTHNYHFNSPTAGCAIGDGAIVKAGNILSYQEGDHHMRDKISIGGDAIGSAVGTNASVKARDIITQVQKTSLDTNFKQKVAEAVEELNNLKIDEGDKIDVADDVQKLTKELDNPAKDESRIKKIWNRIQGAAPTVAAILAGAASLGKILGLIK